MRVGGRYLPLYNPSCGCCYCSHFHSSVLGLLSGKIYQICVILDPLTLLFPGQLLLISNLAAVQSHLANPLEAEFHSVLSMVLYLPCTGFIPLLLTTLCWFVKMQLRYLIRVHRQGRRAFIIQSDQGKGLKGDWSKDNLHLQFNYQTKCFLQVKSSLMFHCPCYYF